MDLKPGEANPSTDWPHLTARQPAYGTSADPGRYAVSRISEGKTVYTLLIASFWIAPLNPWTQESVSDPQPNETAAIVINNDDWEQQQKALEAARIPPRLERVFVDFSDPIET